MPILLADTFTASLARLTNDEHKQAKLTAFDLQTAPDAPRLKYHRIDASKDPERLVGAVEPRPAHHRPQDRRLSPRL
jgi:hypothetical protein